MPQPKRVRQERTRALTGVANQIKSGARASALACGPPEVERIYGVQFAMAATILVVSALANRSEGLFLLHWRRCVRIILQWFLYIDRRFEDEMKSWLRGR